MGTFCKNCPFKDVKSNRKEMDENNSEIKSCTELFAKKYHNSCVVFNINKNE